MKGYIYQFTLVIFGQISSNFEIFTCFLGSFSSRSIGLKPIYLNFAMVADIYLKMA